MIDKPPKIEKKDDIGRSQSENIAKKEIDKIRKVLNGEADSSEVAGVCCIWHIYILHLECCKAIEP